MSTEDVVPDPVVVEDMSDEDLAAPSGPRASSLTIGTQLDAWDAEAEAAWRSKQLYVWSPEKKEYFPISNENIPKEFVCPLTKAPMLDPAMAASGNNYERRAISDYLQTHDEDPVTKEKLEHKHLSPNKVLKGQIKDFLKDHPSALSRPLYQVVCPLNEFTEVDVDDVQRLLLNGANPNVADDRRNGTLLHKVAAVPEPRADVARWLIVHRADVNAGANSSKDEWPPLYEMFHASGGRSLTDGHVSMLKLLIENGAQTEFKGGKYDQDTLLVLIADNEAAGDYGNECAKILLEHKASVDDGLPLAAAAMADNVGLAKVLLEAKADPSKQKALHVCKSDEMGELLLEAKASANSTDAKGWTPLHAAVANGHTGLIKMLFKFAAHANVRDTQGNTPLHILAKKAQSEEVTEAEAEALTHILLLNDADPQVKNVAGQTPARLYPPMLRFTALKSMHARMLKLLKQIWELEATNKKQASRIAAMEDTHTVQLTAREARAVRAERKVRELEQRLKQVEEEREKERAESEAAVQAARASAVSAISTSYRGSLDMESDSPPAFKPKPPPSGFQ